MKRPLAAILLVLALAAPACGNRDLTPEQKTRRFLTATREQPHDFIYESRFTSTLVDNRDRIKVTGEIEDDLRNRQILSINGTDTIERAIIDDSLAVHVIDPSRVPVLAQPTVGGSVIIGDALRQGRWVQDPSGAPPVVPARSTDPRQISVGIDPLQDSLQIFNYAIRAMDEAASVIQFNENAINYRPDLDPFRHPSKAIGELRFDLIRQTLPGRSARSQRLPGIGSFRKMSFYVVDGKVTQILERISIKDHEDFVEAKTDSRKKYLLDMQRDVLEGKGPTPIIERTMSYRFVAIGSENKIAVPGDVLIASLKGIFTATPTVPAPGGITPRAAAEPTPQPAGQGTPTDTATPAGGEQPASPPPPGPSP